MSNKIHLQLKYKTETFTIKGDENGVRLFVDPPNRRNGCENYDSWFGHYGRPFKRTQDAKGALTKFLGLSGWEDMNEKDSNNGG